MRNASISAAIYRSISHADESTLYNLLINNKIEYLNLVQFLILTAENIPASAGITWHVAYLLQSQT